MPREINQTVPGRLAWYPEGSTHPALLWKKTTVHRSDYYQQSSTVKRVDNDWQIADFFPWWRLKTE
ncbi:hypothetical protein KAR34_13005 [bacterium]|nr:hypothetical protein [bacterium]